MTRYILIFALISAVYSPAFSAQSSDTEMPPASLINLENKNIEVRITPNGEVALYEVTEPDWSAFMSEENQYAWMTPPDSVPFILHGEKLHSPIPDNVARRLSSSEENAFISQLGDTVTAKARATALSFCDSRVRPERIGATAGFSIPSVLTFNATWNVDELCADSSTEPNTTVSTNTDQATPDN